MLNVKFDLLLARVEKNEIIAVEKINGYYFGVYGKYEGVKIDEKNIIRD